MGLQRLTVMEILQTPQLQTFLFKFWYLTFTLDSWRPEDPYTRTIRKNLSFANSIFLQIPLYVYKLFLERVQAGMHKFNCQPVMKQILSTYSEKTNYISFEDFSMHYIELYSGVLHGMKGSDLVQYTKKLYLAISNNKEPLKMFDLDKIKPVDNPFPFQQSDVHIHRNLSRDSQHLQWQLQQQSSSIEGHEMTKLQDRLEAIRQFNSQYREEKDTYGVGDKLKQGPKVPISCYMIGQHQIEDYTPTINNLHKELLSKIRVHKGHR